MFTILHISDLHRSKEEPLDNNTLLSSLLDDRDRYWGETPPIPPPEAIVVSGDLIQGVPLGGGDWRQGIVDQYAIAGEFLTALCERFLGGEKDRLVLVPGNHDVCWNTAYRAMEAVPYSDYPDKLHEAIIEPGSIYRWYWKERALYRITDVNMYRKRLDCYWDFIESFYSGVDLRVKIDRTSSFQLFELCEKRIVIAAFSSVDGNDCFSFSGEIASEAIGQCAIGLRDRGHSYDLKIAVWHHSIEGPPRRSDYLDASRVQQMVGSGFQLGLHGHQHVSATLTQSVHLNESLSMAVIGAGSLCAGSRELPRGVDRQYNLIVVDDDFCKARVHVREMAGGNQFTGKRDGPFLGGYVEIKWQLPTNIAGQKDSAQGANEQRAILEAEDAFRGGRLRDAEIALDGVDVSSPSHARRLLVEILRHQENWERLAGTLRDPNNVEEVVTLVMALVECDQLTEAQGRLDGATGVDAAMRSELQGRIDLKKLMRKS